MSPRAKIALVTVLLSSSSASLVFGGRRIVEQRRTTAEIERLRGELYRERLAADRCRSSLATGEASLHALNETIDSLRTRVDSLEALGGGRVPRDLYDEYLETFETHNDSVAAFEVRSGRLRTAETACRATIERHNALSDSIQLVLQGAGIELG